MSITVAELDVSDKTVGERWRRVKADFWDDLKAETLRAVQRLLETSLDIEVQDLIGGRRWAHLPQRGTYRNGHYTRSWLTSVGWIPRLRVPRVRSGALRFRALPRYRRRAKDVDQLVVDMFLAGVSTRRVQEVLTPLVGARALSASVVSRLSQRLDRQVRRWHHRPLADGYRYLLLDGIYLRSKSPLHVRRRCVLVVSGITTDGRRELVDFTLAPQGESQSAWERFLSNLRARGLEGRALALLVIDGNQGLWHALDLVWPTVPRQRCWAHKLRNVANHLPKTYQALCMNGARAIYTAPSRQAALQAFRHWARLWRGICPAAVACLEQDLEDLLPFYQCPSTLWVKLRTTNLIERVFLEVRRRTRPMSCFQNPASVDRIIYALFHRHNERWKDKPLWRPKNNART
ncbi:MAG: IS256 family transposase [Elusimicrobia bacterium]|nr:IS256 family transposase [Elusimicrobiota bacterium]